MDYSGYAVGLTSVVLIIMMLLAIIVGLTYVIGVLFEFTILWKITCFVLRFIADAFKFGYGLLRSLLGGQAPKQKEDLALPPKSPAIAQDDVIRCQCGATIPYPGAYCSWCGRGERKKND